MLGFRLLWVTSFLVLSVVRSGITTAYSHNITLESTAPEIVWSPALCNASLNDANCSSAWRLSDDVPGPMVTTTNGPDPAAGDIIPQMFLSFKGSAIYIYTSPLSTATANISFSSTSIVTTHTDTEVNSSVGWISAVDLPQDVVTLTITYVPDSGRQDGDAGRLDIQFIVITVASISATSSFFPSTILPSSSILPIFSHSQTPTSTTRSAAHKQFKSAIIGESVGTVLGIILLVSAGIGLVSWRRRRIRMRLEASEREWGDYERGRSTARNSVWF